MRKLDYRRFLQATRLTCFAEPMRLSALCSLDVQALVAADMELVQIVALMSHQDSCNVVARRLLVLPDYLSSNFHPFSESSNFPNLAHPSSLVHPHSLHFSQAGPFELNNGIEIKHVWIRTQADVFEAHGTRRPRPSRFEFQLENMVEALPLTGCPHKDQACCTVTVRVCAEAETEQRFFDEITQKVKGVFAQICAPWYFQQALLSTT